MSLGSVNDGCRKRANESCTGCRSLRMLISQADRTGSVEFLVGNDWIESRARPDSVTRVPESSQRNEECRRPSRGVLRVAPL